MAEKEGVGGGDTNGAGTYDGDLDGLKLLSMETLDHDDRSSDVTHLGMALDFRAWYRHFCCYVFCGECR